MFRRVSDLDRLFFTFDLRSVFGDKRSGCFGLGGLLVSERKVGGVVGWVFGNFAIGFDKALFGEMNRQGRWGGPFDLGPGH